ncbi:MAG: addiction module protein [Deltaproteobacteria bacterium]|nr:addiction module protein [Candidatus Tharpella sp.]
MRPLSLKDINSVLHSRQEEIRLEYGVAEIGVFGSCVRGENTEDSDVDILVSFDKPLGFFKFLELEEHLSEWLGAKVDLVTREALKPHIGHHILNEVVMLSDLLKLPRQERAFLADRLLGSLDAEVFNDVEEAWIEEAERRYQEYKSGKRSGIASQAVFAEADLILK